MDIIPGTLCCLCTADFRNFRSSVEMPDSAPLSGLRRSQDMLQEDHQSLSMCAFQYHSYSPKLGLYQGNQVIKSAGLGSSSFDLHGHRAIIELLDIAPERVWLASRSGK